MQLTGCVDLLYLEAQHDTYNELYATQHAHSRKKLSTHVWSMTNQIIPVIKLSNRRPLYAQTLFGVVGLGFFPVVVHVRISPLSTRTTDQNDCNYDESWEHGPRLEPVTNDY